MQVCSVFGCTNNSTCPQAANGSITFHTFPKDTQIQKAWIKAVHRRFWKPPTSGAVCSVHFKDEYFEKVYFAVVRLRENAVPTIFPEFPVDVPQPEERRSISFQIDGNVAKHRDDSIHMPQLILKSEAELLGLHTVKEDIEADSEPVYHDVVKVANSEEIIKNLLERAETKSVRFCKICITSKRLNYIHILDKDQISIYHKLVTCIPVMADKVVQMGHICNRCCKKVKEMFSFRQFCLQSLEVTKEYNTNIYLEKQVQSTNNITSLDSNGNHSDRTYQEKASNILHNTQVGSEPHFHFVSVSNSNIMQVDDDFLEDNGCSQDPVIENVPCIQPSIPPNTSKSNAYNIQYKKSAHQNTVSTNTSKYSFDQNSLERIKMQMTKIIQNIMLKFPENNLRSVMNQSSNVEKTTLSSGPSECSLLTHSAPVSQPSVTSTTQPFDTTQSSVSTQSPLVIQPSVTTHSSVDAQSLVATQLLVPSSVPTQFSLVTQPPATVQAFITTQSSAVTHPTITTQTSTTLHPSVTTQSLHTTQCSVSTQPLVTAQSSLVTIPSVTTLPSVITSLVTQSLEVSECLTVTKTSVTTLPSVTTQSLISTEPSTIEPSAAEQSVVIQPCTTSALVMSSEDETSDIKRYWCKICKEGFLKDEDLKIHKQTHYEGKIIVCHICELEFNNLEKLEEHKVIHRFNDVGFLCEICGKMVTLIKTLKDHRLIHFGKKPYVCEVCNRSFRISQQLKIHQRYHTGYKPHICNVCSKGFVSKKHVEQHMLIHSDKLPYKCDFCDKAFKVAWVLKEHRNIHTGNRPHKCQVCNDVFTFSSELSLHKLKHKVKSFICETCGEAFYQQAVLKTHLKKHLEENFYKCQTCHKGFQKKSLLRNHKKTHTTDKLYSCQICDKKFKTLQLLRQHKKIHNKKSGEDIGVEVPRILRRRVCKK